jgi:cytochrome c
MPPCASISASVGQNVGGGKVRSDFSDIGDPTSFALPEGSARRGEKMFKKHCAQCHSVYVDNRITRQGTTQLGPTLFGVYGRASGQMEIQQKVLMGGRAEGTVWTSGALMNYMKNPRQAVDSNIQMNFRGIDDFQTRVDIVHYLKTLDHSNKAVADPPPRPVCLPPVFPFNVIQHYWCEK